MQNLKDLKILVVDDEPDILEILSSFLSRFGMDVKTASSFEEAKDALENNKFAVVLSDVRMPGKDGFDLLACVRDELDDDIPFIIMSGFTDYTKEDIEEKGGQVLMRKPLEMKILLNRISELAAN